MVVMVIAQPPLHMVNIVIHHATKSMNKWVQPRALWDYSARRSANPNLAPDPTQTMVAMAIVQSQLPMVKLVIQYAAQALS
jgi:hypothetical protein